MTSQKGTETKHKENRQSKKGEEEDKAIKREDEEESDKR